MRSKSENRKSYPLADRHESNQMFDLIMVKISANRQSSADVLFTMNFSLNFACNRFRIEIRSKWIVTTHLDMIIPTSKQINQTLLTVFGWTTIWLIVLNKFESCKWLNICDQIIVSHFATIKITFARECLDVIQILCTNETEREIKEKSKKLKETHVSCAKESLSCLFSALWLGNDNVIHCEIGEIRLPMA